VAQTNDFSPMKRSTTDLAICGGTGDRRQEYGRVKRNLSWEFENECDTNFCNAYCPQSAFGSKRVAETLRKKG
jgi:hypothetical protein